MELTPSERVRLNSAIVRSTRTGQPLSPELQAMYDRAATTEQARKTQTAYPTRDVSDIIHDRTVDISQGIRFNKPGAAVQIVPHSGPASSLPVTDWEELYPKKVPVAYSAVDAFAQPFNREFDFTEDSLDPAKSESVINRSKRFINQYFQGEDPGAVKNSATGRFYGNELKIHDAMHDFANVGNTLRGEELITIAENIGATPLNARNVGLGGLTQQVADSSSPGEGYDYALEDARQNARMGGPFLVQRRGAAQGSSLFRDRNNVASFLSPPISKEEFNTMAQRGQEFYDQVHQNWNAFKHGGSVEWSDARTREGHKLRSKALDEFMGNDWMTKPNAERYDPPRALTQKIAGGYNTGGLPYGNHLSLMNAPLVPTVDRDLWQKELNKISESGIPNVQEAIAKEKQFYESPEQAELRQLPSKWKTRANALNSVFGEDLGYLNWVADKYKKQGLDVNSSEIQRDLRVYQALNKSNPGGRSVLSMLEDTIGPEPLKPSIGKTAPVAVAVEGLADLWGTPKDENYFKTVSKSGNIRDALRRVVDEARNSAATGVRAGVPEGIYEDRIYLNPPNLGSQVKEGVSFPSTSQSGKTLLQASKIDPEDALLTAAAKAKQIEGYNKAFPGIKRAIRTGFDTTTDIAGSVPLFDPAFRQAVEQGNVGKAARQVASEYAIGTAMAPVVGAGMGVLQRVAPQAARVATGALGAARIANPVAVTSQLGGSSRINTQADKTAIQSQFQRAEAARKRGGKWKFPTPFGQFTVPELGISEAGGLFFR